MANVGSLFASMALRSASFSRDTKKVRDAFASMSGEMRKQIRQIEAANRNLNRAISTASKGLFNFRNAIAAAGIGLLLRDVIKTSAEFQRLQASLKTVTGSAEAAGKAFATIKTFAATTPFDLQQVTGAFIRLKSLGLDPSEQALRSYGNTASAMGKQLSDFIEAVADATTGEFERLKEFGIRAATEGSKVTFTFQNVATTVGKNAAEIEAYLRKIGQVQYAGAMEEQARTLGGALSNLQDAVSVFQNEVGEGGFASAVADVARELAAAASGSDNFARSLGQGLGEAVRTAADVARDASRWLREIGAALALIASYKAARMFGLIAEALVVYVARVRVAREATGLLTAAMATNPVGLFAVGLSTLVSTLVLTETGLDDVRRAVTWLREKAEAFIPASGGTLAQGLRVVIQGLDLLVNETWKVGEAMTRAADLAVAAWRAVGDAVDLAVNSVVGRAQALGSIAESVAALATGDFIGFKKAAAEADAAMAGLTQTTAEGWVKIGKALDAARAAFNRPWIKPGTAAAAARDLDMVLGVLSTFRTSAKETGDTVAETAATVDKKVTKALEKAREEVEQLRLVQDLYVRQGKTLREAERARELLARAQDANIQKGSAEYDQLKRDLELRDKLTDEIDRETKVREIRQKQIEAAAQKMRDAAQKAEEDWKHSIDRIVDFWADTWTSVLDGSLRDAGDFAESLKSLLLKTFAQISANAVIRPILDGSGLGGAGGLLQGAQSLAPLGLAALGSANQSTLTSGLGSLSAILSGPSTFGTSLLSFGASKAGSTLASIGLLEPAKGLYNVGIAGSGYVATGLGNSLAAGINASPYGAIGTLAGQLLGFQSRNPYVGAGLGVAGSVAGGALGAAALGTAVGGPVGAIAGALLAQIASSYIGAKASVGPNASASLGFSGGQFNVGTSGSDNGGDAGPFTQGVQQVATALNAIMKAAGLSVTDPSQSFWRFGLGTPGVSRFGQDPQALLKQVLSAGVFTADDPNVAAVMGRLSGDLNEMLSQIDFAATFEDALQAMQAGALDFRDVLRNQVKAEVEGQVDALKAFAEQTAELGLDTARAETATRDYVRTLLGLRPEPETLTAVEAAMLRVNTTFEELAPLLDQVGISSAEAQGGLQKLTAQIRNDFVRSLEADINEVTGLGVVNAISSLIAAADQNRRSARAAGADVSLVDQWLAAKIRAELARADEAGVLAVLDQLAQSPIAVTLANEALAALNATVEETAEAATVAAADMAALDRQLKDEMAGALREMAQEAGRVADRFEDFARSLGTFRLDLLVGNLSPLSSADQLAAARSRLTGLQAGLAAGDVTAFEDVQNAVRQFLEASQAYNASGPGFAADFAFAQDLLAQAEDAAAQQAAEQRRLEQAALRQVEELQGIRSVLDGLSQPLIEFAQLGAQVLAGQAGGQSAVDAQHALLRQMGPDELAVALGSMAPGGQGQAFARSLLGGRSFSAEIQQGLKDQFTALSQQHQAGAISGPDAIRQQLAILSRSDRETLQYFQSLLNPKGPNAGSVQDFLMQFYGMATTNGIPGFAAGGVTPADGPSILHRGEIFYTGPQGRVFSAAELAGLEISAGGRGAANDDEIAGLRAEVRRNTKVMAQGLQGVIDAVQQGNSQRAVAMGQQLRARLDDGGSMRRRAAGGRR